MDYGKRLKLTFDRVVSHVSNIEIVNFALRDFYGDYLFPTNITYGNTTSEVYLSFADFNNILEPCELVCFGCAKMGSADLPFEAFTQSLKFYNLYPIPSNNEYLELTSIEMTGEIATAGNINGNILEYLNLASVEMSATYLEITLKERYENEYLQLSSVTMTGQYCDINGIPLKEESMEQNIQIGLHNEFEFIRRDAKTGKEIERYKSYNIILNNFWTQFISASGADNIMDYIRFGTGVAVPSVSDVKLATHLGYKATGAVTYDFSRLWTDGIGSVKKSIRLQDTEYNGSTISEVGLSHSTSATTLLCTRSLIKDQNGNAISILKNAGEVLDIFATFYAKIDPNYLLPNNPIKITAFLQFFNFMLLQTYPSQTLYATFIKDRAQIQTSKQADTLPTTLTYTAGAGTIAYDIPNKKITWPISNVVALSGNVAGGFRSLVLRGLGLHIDIPNASFAQPVLTKEVIATGDGTIKDWNTSFGWIKDNGTFKLYYNDIEQVGATCEFGKPLPSSEIVDFINIIDYYKYTDYTGSGNNGSPGIHSTAGAGDVGSCFIGSYTIFENPFYADGIDTFYPNTTEVYSSDSADGPWVLVTATSGSQAMPVDHKFKRYWKVNGTTRDSKLRNIVSNTFGARKLIHGATAPAVGATVSVTYQPDVIAKDALHVLNNISVSAIFNEYTP